jgi:hypothetical protein
MKQSSQIEYCISADWALARYCCHKVYKLHEYTIPGALTLLLLLLLLTDGSWFLLRCSFFQPRAWRKHCLGSPVASCDIWITFDVFCRVVSAVCDGIFPIAPMSNTIIHANRRMPKVVETVWLVHGSCDTSHAVTATATGQWMGIGMGIRTILKEAMMRKMTHG